MLLDNSHGRIRIFAETQSPQQTIADLNDKVAACIQDAEAIQNKADAEGRSMNEEEDRRFTELLDQVDGIKAEVARRERLLNNQSQLARPNPRKTVPVDAPQDSPIPQNAAQAPKQRSQITGGLAVSATAGNRGFRSLGEFCKRVRSAVRGDIDPRLSVMNAPSTYGQEGVGEDGGFSVPPDFRQEIMEKVLGEDSLMGLCDELFSSSNQITVPKDETTPWQTSGGILAYWENEAQQLSQSKPELQSNTVRLNKLTALVPVTDELLEDVGALSAYVRKKAPEKINFAINNAIVFGTGVGQPLGIMNSGALVSVAEESGQTAATIVFNNITRMWARMYGPCRSGAIWLMNQDCEPQLQTMVVTGTASVGFPAYLPPGGLSGLPYSTLMGRRIFVTEACQALGTTGDIILFDPRTYMIATKVGGMREDVSIHLWFDYDVTAYRFIIRVGGQSWWTSSIARKNGSNRLSCMVALATRS